MAVKKCAKCQEVKEIVGFGQCEDCLKLTMAEIPEELLISDWEAVIWKSGL